MKNNSTRNFSTKSFSSSSSSSPRWSEELIQYCEHPETFSANEVYHFDNEFVIITDKYPKAKKHFLVMPRKRIDGIENLKKRDLGMMKKLKEKGQWVIESMKGENPKLKFRMGFHALPSMKQFHMHVISQDFISPALKNKKHWNSFTTPFFKDYEEIENMLKEKEEIKFDKIYYETLLKKPLNCHLCNKKDIKNIPTLKRHLEDHWDDDSSEKSE
ncbi:3734_t:CDS:2 [Diversispora eburnea]|uniref:3734_t:CDS:1 n=1 Tax=Diversispora eburnea TaxID=1213867 RepID=A0A9N8WMS5_9GLOM|nr:3734_t:CDS:2 [Diversispora eburnea]